MGKELAVKASIDVGDNIQHLVEKLAQQIGTTADKVFPWYVKQQILEGIMFFVMDFIAFTFGIVLIYLFRKASFEQESKETVFLSIGYVFIGLGFIFLFIGSVTSIAKIMNPNLYALQSMIKDMSILVGR